MDSSPEMKRILETVDVCMKTGPVVIATDPIGAIVLLSLLQMALKDPRVVQDGVPHAIGGKIVERIRKTLPHPMPALADEAVRTWLQEPLAESAGRPQAKPAPQASAN